VPLCVADPTWRCDSVAHGTVDEPRAAPRSIPGTASDDGGTPAVTAALPGAGVVEWLFGTFGPFVIPVAVFVVGIVGYFLLLALGRLGLVGRR
jgi:hypothetical protein